jgi:hypothetical protein
MVKYLQTNEQGYITGIVDEPLLGGLFGGSPKNYREFDDSEAERIRTLLNACHSRGEGLHIEDLVEFKSEERK